MWPHHLWDDAEPLSLRQPFANAFRFMLILIILKRRDFVRGLICVSVCVCVARTEQIQIIIFAIHFQFKYFCENYCKLFPILKRIENIYATRTKRVCAMWFIASTVHAPRMAVLVRIERINRMIYTVLLYAASVRMLYGMRNPVG